MGWRCSHVLKSKSLSNHILAVHENVKGRGHGLLDFRASTQESSIYKCWSLKVFWGLVSRGAGGFDLEEEVSRWV